ncbi:MAG: hypothetical protein MUD08_13855 [Cytophagales bacterium]|nr:hypothetical protein [Cytophagales bacterium]
MNFLPNPFWRKWTISCAAGELLGIGCAGAIAFLVNRALGEPVMLAEKLIVLGCMLGAGAIEGTLLGWFQWRVLKEKILPLTARDWIGMTVLIAVLGWGLGMLPSLFFIPDNPKPTETAAPSAFENPWVFAGLSIGAGLVLGAMFGLFQWFALRKYVPKSASWITANALGWGAGLGWIYLFASLPNEQTPLWVNVLLGIAGGVLAGLSVGAVTGWFLLKIVSFQTPKPILLNHF